MMAPIEISRPPSPLSVEELLDRVGEGMGRAKRFGQVTEAAQPFVIAALVRQRASRRVWVICPHIRTQEQVQHDLPIWGIRSSFLPQVDFSGFADALPDPEVGAERMGVLRKMAGASDEGVVVLCEESLEDLVPTPDTLMAQERTLRVGEDLNFQGFTQELEEIGYERTVQVFSRGQYAVRGGIVDVFPWQSTLPLRIELFDEEIESLREFDVDDQTSVARLKEASILLSASAKEEHGALRDFIRKGDLVVWVQCSGKVPTRQEVWISEDESGGSLGRRDPLVCEPNPLGAFSAGDFILQEAKRGEFLSQMRDWEEEGWTVPMFFHTKGEQDRFSELADADFLSSGFLTPMQGQLGRGFTVPKAKVAILSDAELFGRYQNLRGRRLATKRAKQKRSQGEADLRQFEEGDLVVHQEYGIGRFLEIGEKDGREVLVLEYADRAKLYVPTELGHLLSRYVGTGRGRPELTKLGGNRWNRTREKAEESIMDYAEQLLAIQAERTLTKDYVHEEDSKWQWEFENSFLYRETPDQLQAIEESKQDMVSTQPMDRLICGDVGFGKTEVAIRAAFKSVMSGRQVAFLVPTTVLAQQHYQNLRERMSDYPIKIDLLSRYRSPAQQRETIKNILNGEVDIVVGTHRLISKDIEFQKLGLVIIDEEQRFGVRHKERFKELFRMIDVLTLSATPIPRTLYLALLGVRDMSTIDTPPPNRIPVATAIVPYDEAIIQQSVERELKRQGQVFFLHNRVQTIGKVKETIERLCPGAKVEYGHGQMEEGELEDVMNRFIRHEFDVLVATTMIESGIDIPNANTIIIDRADRFGLADLYQLRGRVGRATEKAYAILMIPEDLLTAGDARKRINAIKQYTALGSGFKIAMRDLEIRGAGNLLGT
ncbi:MAG: DEAD/DEAH box helicase, partial [Verrucomicrobiota bacterium]